MSQMITIKLSRSEGQSWGFRLQGGKDFATPLCIQKVNMSSVAEKAGLQAGDQIVSIAGGDALGLRHKEAQDKIVKSGNVFDLVIQRGQAWKPAVTPLAEMRSTPAGPVATETSLAANKQYNTPLNLYSEDNIAETLSAQAEVLGKGKCLGINFKKFEIERNINVNSPTYLLLHGDGPVEEGKKPRQLPAQDSTTGSSQPVFPARPVELGQQGGNKGYYNINEKLYCDVHAKQAARHQAPGPNMEPVLVKPGGVAPKSAVTAAQAKFQAPAPAPVPALIKPPAGGVRILPMAPGIVPSGGFGANSFKVSLGNSNLTHPTSPKPYFCHKQ